MRKRLNELGHDLLLCREDVGNGSDSASALRVECYTRCAVCGKLCGGNDEW